MSPEPPLRSRRIDRTPTRHEHFDVKMARARKAGIVDGEFEAVRTIDFTPPRPERAPRKLLINAAVVEITKNFNDATRAFRRQKLKQIKERLVLSMFDRIGKGATNCVNEFVFGLGRNYVESDVWHCRSPIS